MRPEPPADLWDQLAVLNEQAVSGGAARPANSFTATEYADKFGISSSTALRRIGKLIKSGEVHKHGKTGTAVCYTVAKEI